DYCSFGTQAGTVIDIGIRSSRVRTLDRTVVTVPNSDFSSMQIENYTSRDMFHFLHNLYIKRNADIDVIFKMVKDLDKFLNDHELTNQEWNQANILELRQDCYIIQLRAYVNSFDVIEFYGKQDTLLVEILTLVKKYKVEHALPTQQLIVNQAELEPQHQIETVIEGDINDPVNDALSEENDSDDTSAQDTIDLDKKGNSADNNGADNKKKTASTKLKKNITLKALKNRSRILKKSKFKRTKRKFDFSIWNQPYN
ncbi:MAG: mechanosensitive ion channel family protein, partial [Psychrobacter sp.]|nr:mechanosensitive ion channel family protein [Psychrobacter sp.]